MRGLLSWGSVLVVSFALVASAGWAQSVEIPVSGTGITETIDPGRQWTDDDGVLHVRGIVQVSALQGQDIDGVPITATGRYEANFNMDMATGDGDLNVKAHLEMTYGDLQGTYDGRLTATASGFVWDGEANYSRGGGDFNGWHFRGTFTKVFGPHPTQWQGVFHKPHGD